MCDYSTTCTYLYFSVPALLAHFSLVLVYSNVPVNVRYYVVVGVTSTR